jgi:hypothetical protein
MDKLSLLKNLSFSQKKTLFFTEKNLVFQVDNLSFLSRPELCSEETKLSLLRLSFRPSVDKSLCTDYLEFS